MVKNIYEMLLEFCTSSISIALTCKEATLQFVARRGLTAAVAAHYLPIVEPGPVWSQPGLSWEFNSI